MQTKLDGKDEGLGYSSYVQQHFKVWM